MEVKALENNLGKPVNPWPELGEMCQPVKNWQDFEDKHPTLPLSIPIKQGEVVWCDDDPVWQYKFMELDWKGCAVFYSKQECDISGIPTRQVYKVIEQPIDTKSQQGDNNVILSTPPQSHSVSNGWNCGNDPMINQELYKALNLYTMEVTDSETTFDKFVDDGNNDGIGCVATRIVSHVFAQWQQSNSRQDVVEIINDRLSKIAVSAQRNQMQDYAPIENELNYILELLTNGK